MTPTYPPELHQLIVQDIREVFSMTDYNPSMIDGGQNNKECAFCHNQIHEDSQICPYCQEPLQGFCPLCGDFSATFPGDSYCQVCNFSLADPRDKTDLIWEEEELPHIIAKHKENMVQ